MQTRTQTDAGWWNVSTKPRVGRDGQGINQVYFELSQDGISTGFGAEFPQDKPDQVNPCKREFVETLRTMFGVDHLDQIVGRAVLVRRTGLQITALSIGNGVWFESETLFSKYARH